MSNSRRFCHKEPEKSTSFVQTCNLLSEYVKKKGSLRDLNLEIGGKMESLQDIDKNLAGHSFSVNSRSSNADSASGTMDLLTNMEKLAQPLTDQSPAAEHFSGRLAVPKSPIIIDLKKDSNSSSKEATPMGLKSAQLTMFYGGRVLVFDDYPMHKAKKLVSLAKKESSKMSYGISSNIFHQKVNHCGATSSTSSVREGLPPRPQANTCHKPIGTSSNTCKMIMSSEAVESSSRPEDDSDLPIARRSSINRFLEKRKDRSGARGPYQIQDQTGPSYKDGEL